jgi:hypothetical protein
MALVLKDRVKETTTTTGTGSFSLAGAVTGYDSFGQIGTGNTTYYAVYLDGGSEWEVGIGTYTAPSTLSRDTILASSNSGNIVTFSAGQKTIWCDYPAGKAVYLDASGSISEPIVNISGITGHINTVDYIGFDTGYNTTLTAGQLGWDGNNTLGLGMFGGNVVQKIGEDTFFYVKASAAITKGQLCMFTGAVGSSGVVTAAPATAIPYAEAIIGIAAEDIANNGFGLIQNTGTLKGVDTSAFLDGDILYYNSAVTGGFTKTFPTSGPIVICAVVAKAGSGGSGVLTVRISFQTRVTAGTGMSVTQGNDVVTVTNSAPDQLVSLTGAGTTSITGAYPNFTITSNDQFDGTVTSVDLSAGTGITVSGGPITSSGSITVTNSAPDQIVSLTGAGTTSISGTYPNFTITSNDQYTGTVTSVSGSAPIASSGGNTPTISITQATTSTDGYLSSTDWNTFNGKANAFTYTTNYIPYGQGTTTPNQSANLTYDGTTLKAQVVSASNGIVMNNMTINDDYSFPSGYSGSSVGPVTVATGKTVTVASGSRWVVL